jgi:hypothetical protein
MRTTTSNMCQDASQIEFTLQVSSVQNFVLFYISQDKNILGVIAYLDATTHSNATPLFKSIPFS